MCARLPGVCSPRALGPAGLSRPGGPRLASLGSAGWKLDSEIVAFYEWVKPPKTAPSPWAYPHLRRTPASVGRDAWLPYLPSWKQSVIRYQNEQLHFSLQSWLVLTWEEQGSLWRGRKIMCYF